MLTKKQITLKNGQVANVLQYLPILQKKTFVWFVSDNSFIEDENGIVKFDPTERTVNNLYAIIKFYTDIKFNGDENIYDIFDKFQTSGDIDLILGAIPSDEIIDLEYMIDEAIEEKKREQSEIGIVLAKFLEKVNSKIPDSKGINKLIKSLGKELKNISPENMDLLKSVLGQNNIGVKKSGGK